MANNLLKTSIMVLNNLPKKILKFVLVTAFWITIWEAAHLLVGEDLVLFLPSPFAVLVSFGKLVFTAEFWNATLATVGRIFAGFAIGCITGIISGIFTSSVGIADALLSPMLRIIRVVPVVSFVILAFLFIDVDRLPIFIAFLMVVPLVWQSVHDGLRNVDPALPEMGRVFGMKPVAILFKIKLPEISCEILSAIVSGLGFAWKSGIAAEVICTPMISLGKSIYRAKGNFEFDEVYAVTLTVVFLSLIFETALKALCRKYLERREKGKC